MKKTLITKLSLYNLRKMGIEEDFYATVKLKTGEEIFAKVAASEEEDRTILIISNPIMIAEIKGRIIRYRNDYDVPVFCSSV